MKKIALVVLLLSTLCLAASNKNDKFNLTIHVSSSFLTFNGSTCTNQLNILVDGINYQLVGGCDHQEDVHYGPLKPGDYKARLATDDHSRAYLTVQTYEILYPDNRSRKFEVIGNSE